MKVTKSPGFVDVLGGGEFPPNFFETSSRLRIRSICQHIQSKGFARRQVGCIGNGLDFFAH